MNSDVYDRQRMIAGWEQQRLTRARAAIIGGDWLAGYIALYLACLGVGRIYLLDCAKAPHREHFFFPLAAGESRVKGWRGWLAGLGFANEIIPRHTNPLFGSNLILPPVDIIISATGCAELQQALKGYAIQQSVPLVIGSVDHCSGWYMVMTDPDGANWRRPRWSEDTSTDSQGASPGAIIGALMAEESRRLLLPLSGDCPQPPGKMIAYHQSHPRRFAVQDNPPPQNPATDAHLLTAMRTELVADADGQEEGAPRRILLVGGGALGTFAALGLVARNDNCELIVVDHDYIEASNLNRQPLYLHSVGEGKAITLARRLRDIRPGIRISYLAEPVRPHHFEQYRPDLVLCCVDNFAARQMLHRECLRRRIHLINGGTSVFSGHVEVYQPGLSACFNCLYALDDLADREAQDQTDPAHCSRIAEPSVVTTNALIGGIMAAESIQHSAPLGTMLRYDGSLPFRFRVPYARNPCTC